MKVWIDQEACNGDRLCEETVPELFEIRDDSLAYIRLNRNRKFGHAIVGHNQANIYRFGMEAIVEVPEDLEDLVSIAAQECTGECIPHRRIVLLVKPHFRPFGLISLKTHSRSGMISREKS